MKTKKYDDRRNVLAEDERAKVGKKENKAEESIQSIFSPLIFPTNSSCNQNVFKLCITLGHQFSLLSQDLN